jgi:FMN phosphatase YigB (HAD superfamily)
VAEAAAVFFDVDFTLIHPGPRFQGLGYQESCARHGVTVDPARFEQAVRGAAAVLESADELYDASCSSVTPSASSSSWEGSRPAMDAVARELYTDWAEHHHFSLYDDVRDSLQGLVRSRAEAGLISNSHRCLASFSRTSNSKG